MHQLKLKEIREEKGLTQQQLANLADVSRSVIVGLETGSYPETSTITLKKLANSLGVKIKDLFF